MASRKNSPPGLDTATQSIDAASQSPSSLPRSSLPQWNFAGLAQKLLAAADSEPSEPPAPSKGPGTLRALLTLAHVDAVLCEDTRVSGALLHAYGISRPLVAYHEHNAAAREPELIARLLRGEQLALVSDAGMPLIADPGFRLVRACHLVGIKVTVCPGASALLTALTLARLPPLPFVFGGFLPPKSGTRRNALQGWRDTPATLVFYESPLRLVDTLQDIKTVLGDRQAAIGRELTKLYEECRQESLSALIAHYSAHPPKGEIVIVVAPPDAAETVTEDELRRALTEALQTQSLRDAVSAVAAATGAPRKDVYALALLLKP